jgi:three-Cys-motif partner protein
VSNSRGGQGQSRETEHKEVGLRATFLINQRICKAIRDRSRFPDPYWHFDLHAGCGWNKKVNVMGSPLAFYDAVEESGHPQTIAHFVEIDRDTAVQLEERLLPHSNWFVHCEDNAQFCLRIPDIIRGRGKDPRYAMGTILIDPNGPTDTPYDEIAEVMRQCPRLDIVYNFPATGTKRLANGHERKVEIDDIPDLFHKKFWLIRYHIGPQQFSLLVGRNHLVNDYQRLGFEHWDSARGQHYVRTLKMTRQQQARANQMELRL